MTGTPETVALSFVSYPFVVAIVGPTGVGKTAVAEELAVRLDGEIVTADSMQVYRGMDIGTSKLPPAQRRVPHHCLDLVDPGQPFSAALYQQVAREAFADIASHGRLPILCGGTGLYVRAALDDFRFPPGEQAENRTRETYEAYARDNGPRALHALLSSRDPDSAEIIHPNNVKRTIRALEMLDEGVSYAEQHRGFVTRRSLYPCTMLGLTMDRAENYRRIDERVDGMIAAGLIGEVQKLLAAGLRGGLTSSQAIGYKELVPVVEGRAPLEQAVDSIKRASRRYAKRQLTWFRADDRVRWVDVTGLSVHAATDAVEAALD